MTREDIDRIASEYFNDKESEHEMDEVFDLAKKALGERKEDVLKQIQVEITNDIHKCSNTDMAFGMQHTLDIIDKYRGNKE